MSISGFLTGAGNVLDLPGSSVRDVLAFRNPFDQWLTPFEQQNRTTGRELARLYGGAADEDTAANMAGGLGIEMALDPLTWLGVGGAARALRAGVGAARGGSLAQRLTGPVSQRPATASPLAQRLTGEAGGQATRRSVVPAIATSYGAPVAGLGVMASNEDQDPMLNMLATGLMLTPLGMAAARGIRGLAARLAKEGRLPQFTPSVPGGTKDDLRRAIVTMRQSGASTGQIATELNRQGFRTAQGKAHTTGTVQGIEKRLPSDVRAAKGAAPTGPDQAGDAIVSLLQQGMSNADIAAELNRRGIAAKFGKPWTLQKVKDWLQKNTTPEQRQRIRFAAATEPGATPPAGTPQRGLAERLVGPQQQRLSGMETPEARSADVPAAAPLAVATTPPAPPATTVPRGAATRMVTLGDAFTEHDKHIRGYLSKQFRSKGISDPDALDELIADTVARTWQSAHNRPDMASIPAGQGGWDAIKPFLQNRGKDALRAHFGGRGKVGSPGSRHDAYKLSRSEERLGTELPDYEERVGRMGTVADKAPTPVQQAQLNELPQVSDIVQTLSKDHAKKPMYFDALFEDPFMLDKLKASRQPYKHPIWVDMADRIGVSEKTVYNWTKEFAQRLDDMGMNLEAYKDILPLLAAMLGLGGAAGGALARRVAAIPEMPEPSAAPIPAAGPFQFATVDGQPISQRWA